MALEFVTSLAQKAKAVIDNLLYFITPKFNIEIIAEGQ